MLLGLDFLESGRASVKVATDRVTFGGWYIRVACQMEAAAVGDWNTATEVYMCEERQLKARENGVVKVKLSDYGHLRGFTGPRVVEGTHGNDLRGSPLVNNQIISMIQVKV